MGLRPTRAGMKIHSLPLTRGRLGGGRLSPLFSQQIYTGPLDPPRGTKVDLPQRRLAREPDCAIDLVVPAIAQRPLPLRWRCMTPYNRLARAAYGYHVVSPPVKRVSTDGSIFSYPQCGNRWP